MVNIYCTSKHLWSHVSNRDGWKPELHLSVWRQFKFVPSLYKYEGQQMYLESDNGRVLEAHHYFIIIIVVVIVNHQFHIYFVYIFIHSLDVNLSIYPVVCLIVCIKQRGTRLYPRDRQFRLGLPIWAENWEQFTNLGLEMHGSVFIVFYSLLLVVLGPTVVT